VSIAFDPPIPVFRIFSLQKAREFYLGYLGFTLDFEHRFAPDMPVYLQVSRGAVVLHLSEHHGDATPGATVYIRMRGVRDYHRELAGKDYRYMNPGVEKRDWTDAEMTVTDPFGNRIRFGEFAAAATD
jgi:catechol 2,3-dioxygenase-like lactoylglutathione lyase family enzyme